LLWIAALLIGLLAVLLCVTIILLPLGIPLLLLSRKLFGQSMRLVLPRTVTHPVDEGSKSLRKAGDKATSRLSDARPKKLEKKAKKKTKRARKKLPV
jgi:hypothetical protein